MLWCICIIPAGAAARIRYLVPDRWRVGDEVVIWPSERGGSGGRLRVMATMQSGASRRTPVAVSAVRRPSRRPTGAGTARRLSAADAATPPQWCSTSSPSLTPRVRPSKSGHRAQPATPVPPAPPELEQDRAALCADLESASSAQAEAAQKLRGGRGGGRGHHPNARPTARAWDARGRRPERGSRPRVRPSVAGDPPSAAREISIPTETEDGARGRAGGRRGTVAGVRRSPSPCTTGGGHRRGHPDLGPAGAFSPAGGGPAAPGSPGQWQP